MNQFEIILAAAADYYNGTPAMSDAEYDALVAEFARKQPRFYDQWRASYIGPLPAHATPHPFRMLSLRGNTFDAFAEFAEWLTNMPKKVQGYTVQPKIDGHAIAITYLEGRLIRVATRGDGTAGKDITGIFHKNSILPATLVAGSPSPLYLSGELYLPLESWNRSEFATPRNELCSILNTHNHPKRSALKVAIHGVHDWKHAHFADRESQIMAYLNGRLNLPTVPAFELAPRVMLQGYGSTLMGYLEHFRKFLPCDGLVVKADSLAARSALGASATAPLWAYALKTY